MLRGVVGGQQVLEPGDPRVQAAPPRRVQHRSKVPGGVPTSPRGEGGKFRPCCRLSTGTCRVVLAVFPLVLDTAIEEALCSLYENEAANANIENFDNLCKLIDNVATIAHEDDTLMTAIA